MTDEKPKPKSGSYRLMIDCSVCALVSDIEAMLCPLCEGKRKVSMIEAISYHEREGQKKNERES